MTLRNQYSAPQRIYNVIEWDLRRLNRKFLDLAQEETHNDPNAGSMALEMYVLFNRYWSNYVILN